MNNNVEDGGNNQNVLELLLRTQNKQKLYDKIHVTNRGKKEKFNNVMHAGQQSRRAYLRN